MNTDDSGKKPMEPKRFWIVPCGNKYADWSIYGLPQGFPDEFEVHEVLPESDCPNCKRLEDEIRPLKEWKSYYEKKFVAGIFLTND